MPKRNRAARRRAKQNNQVAVKIIGPQNIIGPRSRPSRAPRKRRNRKRRNVQTRLGRGNGTMTSEYIRSVLNPWDYAGCRMGWGTLQPTTCATVYLRGVAAPNADGSLTIAALPNVTNFVSLFQGTHGTAGITASIDATDAAAISANYMHGRVISMGLKCAVSAALSSVPGFAYAGSLCMSPVQFALLSTDDFISFPTTQVVGQGTSGGAAVGRPMDVTSFEFFQAITNTAGWFGSASTLPFSIPFVSFAGMAATATVSYEAIMNIEVMAKQQHGSAAISAGTRPEPSLSNEWLTPDSMWKSVEANLPPVGSTFATAGIGLLTAYLQTKQRRAGLNFRDLEMGGLGRPNPAG